MILPVVAYGDPVLKKEAVEIEKSFEGLGVLVENMFETMYNAQGVGLAAPQIGQSIRLFVVPDLPRAPAHRPRLERIDGLHSECRSAERGQVGVRPVGPEIPRLASALDPAPRAPGPPPTPGAGMHAPAQPRDHPPQSRGPGGPRCGLRTERLDTVSQSADGP